YHVDIDPNRKPRKETSAVQADPSGQGCAQAPADGSVSGRTPPDRPRDPWIRPARATKHDRAAGDVSPRSPGDRTGLRHDNLALSSNTMLPGIAGASHPAPRLDRTGG